MNGMHQAKEQRPLGLPLKVWAGSIVVCIALAHFAYGIWFWTSSPTNAPKASLKLNGDAFLESFPGWNTDEERDQAAYNRSAIEVLRTGIPRYRSGEFFDHAPAYAYFLAMCYWIGGIRLLSVVIPQALLSGLTGLLLARTAYKLSSHLALVAAAIAALLVFVNVRLASFVGTISTATLVVALHAFAFYLAAELGKPGTVALFTGAVILGVYTTASYFLVGCAAVLWLLWRFIRTKRVAYCVGAAAIFIAIGAKVAFVARAGESLREVDKAMFWYGNNPYYESVGWFDLWTVREDPTWTPWLPWRASETEKARYNEYLERAGGDRRKAGLLWAWENPGEYAKMCFVRLRATLGPITGHMRLWQNKLISTVLWLLIFPAGFWGLWQARHTPQAQLGWLIVAAVCGFETFVIAGMQHRYRLPVEVVLLVYASVTYARLLNSMGLKNLGSLQKVHAPLSSDSG